MAANPPLFGANIDPANLHDAFARARLADEHGLDLITAQDHPYNRHHLDTWTLITALATRTERVQVGTNVISTPLRPPALLAKQAASLDVISGGRVMLGLGAGAMWEGIMAYGGPAAAKAKPFTAFKEFLAIMRGMWDNVGHSFKFEGEVYQVRGARPGPVPAHPIPIWVGGYGPKMLHLAGEEADGVLLSNAYITKKDLPAANAHIDAGAVAVGRDPQAVRRGFNLMGHILGGALLEAPADSPFAGTVSDWVTELVSLYHDYGQDTFIVWPYGKHGLEQLHRFTDEIVPAVKAELGF